MKQKQYEEALQYATLGVQVSATTGKTFILLSKKKKKKAIAKLTLEIKANDLLFSKFDYELCKSIIIIIINKSQFDCTLCF